jgi:glycosyltransferase involved in cell wall biosynthesis
VFKGGSVQVAKSFLRECCQFKGDTFGVVLGPGLSAVIRAQDFPANFRFFEVANRPAQRLSALRRPAMELKKIEADFVPDVVFTTSGPSYWRPCAPHLMGFNLPHHLYPDSPYFTRLLSLRQRLRWRVKSMLVHYYTKGFADAWVVQTDDVNKRLRHWLPSDRVYTVPNTVSSEYAFASQEGAARPKLETCDRQEFRLLVLSSYYPHKNLEVLNDIIALIRKRGIYDIRFTMTLRRSSRCPAIIGHTTGVWDGRMLGAVRLKGGRNLPRPRGRRPGKECELRAVSCR